MPNDPRMTSDEWRAFEREARREGELSSKSVYAYDLVLGQRVAWCEYANARTDAISEVHRVAVASGDPETYCGERIPGPACRLDLRVWPENLRACPWCQNAYHLFKRSSAHAHNA